MVWCVWGRKWTGTTSFGEAREGTEWGARLTLKQRPYHFHRALVYELSRLSRQHAPNAHPASQFGGVFCHISFSISLTRSFTASYHIKACFRPVFYNFLAPTAQKTWPLCQARVELGNFSLFRPELSVGSSTRTAKKHDHNSTAPHKHREVFHPPPPLFTLHTSTVTRVSRWLLGHGRTCGGVWEAVFFFFENGDFSYRSRVPTAGICLWWISWAQPSSIIVTNIPLKIFKLRIKVGVNAFQTSERSIRICRNL